MGTASLRFKASGGAARRHRAFVQQRRLPSRRPAVILLKISVWFGEVVPGRGKTHADKSQQVPPRHAELLQSWLCAAPQPAPAPPARGPHCRGCPSGSPHLPKGTPLPGWPPRDVGRAWGRCCARAVQGGSLRV